MGNDGLSTGDLALLKDNDGMGGANAWVWFFMLMFLAGGNGFGWGGGNGNYVTQSDLTNQLNAQAQNAQLQQIALSSANNNYETAQQMFGLQTNLMNQNNTNLINAIQGFNQLSQLVSTQGMGITQAIQQLGDHLDRCCCEIKTQMLQDRLSATQADLVAANGIISNANQTQTILGTMGKWVANPAAASA